MLLYIFLIPLIFYALLLMWLIPLGYTVKSFFTLLTAPGQFFRIAVNKQQRRNHALEHATVNVLEETYGPTHLAGYAAEDGFIIKGFFDPVLIYQASLIGLKRMQNGEKDLALHQRCGTSLAASNLVTSLIFIILLFSTHRATIWTILLALLVGSYVGSLLGPLTQRYITTANDLDSVEIMGYVPNLGEVKIYTKQRETEFLVE